MFKGVRILTKEQIKALLDGQMTEEQIKALFDECLADNPEALFGLNPASNGSQFSSHR